MIYYIGDDIIKNYFKGYYFKCSNNTSSIAFIPALHKSKKNIDASIQIITPNESIYLPFKSINFSKNKLLITIDNNIFSKEKMILNIKNEEYLIEGNIFFSKFKRLKYSIMGPFKYIPFMQCRHSVVSMNHFVNGEIIINDDKYIFNNDLGYIEGDRGYSFPKNYIWSQCHYDDSSIMLSVADIPFLGFHFKGIIGVVMIKNKEYRIATYLGAKVVSISNNEIIIKQGKYKLIAKLIKDNSKDLKAPVNGNMIRIIKESIMCRASYRFIYKENILLDFESDKASFEFEY